MNIVVLAGGVSSERNVSLSSGSLVTRALRERGHRAVMLDVFLGLQDSSGTMEQLFASGTEEALHVVSTEVPDIPAIMASRPTGEGFFGPRVLEACRYADAVFIALHGGAGEDGRVQAVLELLGVPYTGTGPLGSGIAMDKDLSKRLMASAGIPVPQGVTLELKGADFAALAAQLQVPCVVKPVSGGSSIGVTIVREREMLLPALAECARYDDRAVVERYIAGRELTVGVLDGKALPPVEIIPDQGFYDYRNKYQVGAAREICPAPIDGDELARISELAVRVHRALCLGSYSRMEFILNSEDREFYCLEANTLPGMTPTSLLPQEAAAVGMDYGTLCEQLVLLALKHAN